jgi:hypothetical protein
MLHNILRNGERGSGVVAGRVIDSSLESSSLFSILVGEREDSSLSSKARAYLGLVFHINRDFPHDFCRKTPEKNPKTQICMFFQTFIK